MSRESLVFILGFVLLFVPFVGLHTVQKTYLTVGIAVILIFVGYSLRRSRYLRQLERGQGERGNDSFVEKFQERIDYDSASKYE